MCKLFSVTSFGMVAMIVNGCSENNTGAPAGKPPSADGKKRVIILCTGNSCRSQMAEAFWKKYGGEKWEVVSAGTKPKSEVYPLAVEAMAEKGLDIRGYRPKDASGFTKQHFDLVVTVCDNAERECPAFANADEHLHWPFDDPPKAAGDDKAKMIVCRRVRDQIEESIREYLSIESPRSAKR